MAKLRRGELVRISEGQGCEVHVKQGCVWITQHHDTADYVVAAGCSFTIERPGLTLVTATKPSAIEVLAPTPRLAYAA